MDEKKRIKKNLIMFPLGTIGRDMVYALVTNFLMTFVLFTRDLTDAQFSAIAAIMVAARVFDALTGRPGSLRRALHGNPPQKGNPCGQ